MINPFFISLETNKIIPNTIITEKITNAYVLCYKNDHTFDNNFYNKTIESDRFMELCKKLKLIEINDKDVISKLLSNKNHKNYTILLDSDYFNKIQHFSNETYEKSKNTHEMIILMCDLDEKSCRQYLELFLKVTFNFNNLIKIINICKYYNVRFENEKDKFH